MTSPKSQRRGQGVGRFWLKDTKGPTDGSDRCVHHVYVDRQQRPAKCPLCFNDPTTPHSSDAKTPSHAFNLYTKSRNHAAWSAMRDIVRLGYPFYAALAWGNGPVSNRG
jgi:hypothetical protein